MKAFYDFMTRRCCSSSLDYAWTIVCVLFCNPCVESNLFKSYYFQRLLQNSYSRDRDRDNDTSPQKRDEGKTVI